MCRSTGQRRLAGRPVRLRLQPDARPAARGWAADAAPHLRDLLQHDAAGGADPRGRPLLRLHRRPGQQLRRRAGRRPAPRPPEAARWRRATLSIIVPVLNEAAGIAAALQALAPLRARGHEVIVVDGGSRDATRGAGRAAGRPSCSPRRAAARGR